MKAGRKLDALVARLIMKLPGVGFYKRKSYVTHEWVPCAEDDFTEDYPEWKASEYYLPHPLGEIRSIPPYSTEISAAWKVVDKMEADGFEWGMHFEGSRKESGTRPIYVVTFGGGGVPEEEKRRQAVSEDAPLAIVLAALNALGHPVEITKELDENH